MTAAVARCIVAKISADHDLASKFNEALAKLADEREQVVKKLREESAVVLSFLRKEYKYEVQRCLSEVWLPADVRERGGAFRLVRRWTNKELYVQHAKRYGVSCDSDKEAVSVSVVYYRLNNILVSVPGTGSALLKTNQECSDQEWRLVQSGMVPGKFLNV